ncbi:hypothetical protein SAMN03159338_1571 [Sphingomonas sp. NFR04]|uniref:hypothetical protein n=1 Tax=Sphingomonas sp. NFR04 TaxID=1566283 RepID=UPI0008E258B1|nr:hypothetical protein [Sphingomonas sp. NFR04]SFJ49772.1 hypothetical protein SAMN03159338_1571 [Sphingomonas sp. NFR04]
MKVWGCKIGEVDASKLPPGSDAPMRAAVAKAFREITGDDPQFIFSGWGASLAPEERNVVNGWNAAA